MIAACEAVWAFHGGVFRTLIFDSLNAMVQSTDPIEPQLWAGRTLDA